MARDLYAENVSLLLPMSGTVGDKHFNGYSSNQASGVSFGAAAITNEQLHDSRPCLKVLSSYLKGVEIFSPDTFWISSAMTTTAKGAVDFCIEFWVNVPDVTAVIAINLGHPGSGTGTTSENRGGVRIGINAGAVELVGGNLSIDGASGYYSRKTVTTIAANTWNHIAVTCVANVPKVWINGADANLSVSFYAPSAAVVNLSNCKLYCPRCLQLFQALGFAGTTDTTLTSGSIIASSGYISDLRITRGVPRYTALFTPPGRLVIDASPVLLDGAGDHSISGIITDRTGELCQRKIYAVSRPTDATLPVILAHGLSDPTTGAYELIIPSSEEVTRVVVSEDSDPLLNDIVDRVIPA